jgi:hypothetical protein
LQGAGHLKEYFMAFTFLFAMAVIFTDSTPLDGSRFLVYLFSAFSQLVIILFSGKEIPESRSKISPARSLRDASIIKGLWLGAATPFLFWLRDG